MVLDPQVGDLATGRQLECRFFRGDNISSERKRLAGGTWEAPTNLAAVEIKIELKIDAMSLKI